MENITYKSPLYIQLGEVIRNKIDEGEYPPGTAIPSESQLAESYGLNRASVRNALEILENEGLLTSIKGKGVFVNGPKAIRDMETLGGYRNIMESISKEPSTRILVKAQRKAGPYYSLLLDIAEDDNTEYVQRIDYSDGKPMSLEEIYIPEDIIPNFESLDISLFSIYDAYCWNGHRPAAGDQTLRISYLDKTRAKYLNLAPENAVMEFSCITRDSNGRIIEFSRNYVRGDLTEFIVHYNNQQLV